MLTRIHPPAATRPPLADRIVDRIVAALLGGPVRAVLAGAVLFCGLGHYLGWWVVAAIVAAVLADQAWCASRLPRRWRWW